MAGLADLHVSNSDSGVAASLASELAGISGVRSIDPVIIERVALPELDNQTAMVLGVDLKAVAGRENPWGVQVRITNPLALLGGRKPIFLGKELAETLSKTLPSNQNTVQVRLGGRTHRLPRNDGTIDAGGPAAVIGGNMLVMDIAQLALLRGRPQLVTRLDVSLEANANIENVRSRLQELAGSRAVVQTPETQAQSVRDVMAGLQIGFAICGMGALIVGLFLVYNVLSVGVAERRYDIGVLRSLGATRGQVWLLFIGEAAFLGATGALVGLPAGEGLLRASERLRCERS